MNRIFTSLMMIVLWVFLGFGLGVPLFYLAKEALWIDGSISLQYFSIVFHEAMLKDALVNSFNIAALSTFVTFLLAFPLANLMVRLRLPGHGIFEQLLIAPLFLPPFVGVLGLRQFLGRSGTVNLILESMGLIQTPIDFLGEGAVFGIAFVQALHFYPLVYLGLASSLAALNTELEEAAVSVGAGSWSLYRRIIIPLLTPSIISSGLLVFIGSFTDIGTPLLFEYRRTVPVIIFNSLSDLENSGAGYALVCIVGVSAAILFGVARFFEKDRIFASNARSFRAIRPRPVSSPFDAMMCLYLFVVLAISLLPHTGVLLQAFSDRWFMTPFPNSFTNDHFMEVFSHPVAFGSLRYSIVLSCIATLLTGIVGFVAAWRIVRTPGKWTWILESVVMLPLAIPGVVIAFGYIIGYQGTIIDNRVNPTVLLILAYSIRKLPFMVRLLTSGLQSANVELEQAARVFGARGVTVLRRITIPLLAPSLIAGSVLCFLGSLLEVSDSLLLAMEEKYFPIAKALYVLQGRPDGSPIACALALVVMFIVLCGMYGASRITGKRVSQLMRVGS